MNSALHSVHDAQGFKTIAGLDVCYEATAGKLVASAVVMHIETGTTIESAVWAGEIEAEYVPGEFAKRELPSLVNVLQQLSVMPDLLLCDGHGFAHPTRNGLACQLGKLLNIPSIGCAKTRLIGEFTEPDSARGSISELKENGELIGHVVRTQNGINPLFVSAGYQVDLQAASDIVLKLCTAFRIPEPLRAADQLGRTEMKRLLGQ